MSGVTLSQMQDLVRREYDRLETFSNLLIKEGKAVPDYQKRDAKTFEAIDRLIDRCRDDKVIMDRLKQGVQSR